jgi:hypothetical protein
MRDTEAIEIFLQILNLRERHIKVSKQLPTKLTIGYVDYQMLVGNHYIEVDIHSGKPKDGFFGMKIKVLRELEQGKFFIQ